MRIVFHMKISYQFISIASPQYWKMFILYLRKILILREIFSYMPDNSEYFSGTERRNYLNNTENILAS